MKKLSLALLLYGSFVTAQEPLWVEENAHLTYVETHFCCPQSCFDLLQGDLLVFADFLYWQPYNGVPLFTKGHNRHIPGISQVYSEKNDQVLMKFDFAPAWRAGVDFAPCADWNLLFYWTQLFTHESHSIQEIPGVLSLNTFWELMVLSEAAQIDWKTQLHYNVADLELAKSYNVGCFSLRPSIGMRGAWIKQKAKLFSVNYNTASTRTVDSQVRLHNDFSGIGLRGAFGSSWHMGWGWSLVGSGAASLLYGETETKFSERIISSSPVGPFVDRTPIAQNDYFGVKAAVDVLIGLEWKKEFCKHALHFYAAYEMTDWINQWELKASFPFLVDLSSFALRSLLLDMGSDLTMHGLDIGLSLSF